MLDPSLSPADREMAAWMLTADTSQAHLKQLLSSWAAMLVELGVERANALRLIAKCCRAMADHFETLADESAGSADR